MSQGNLECERYSQTELKTKIDQYFQACKDSDEPAVFAGLAEHLMVARTTLCDYVTLVPKTVNKAKHDIIKKACLSIQTGYEKKMLTSKTQIAGTIFAAKAWNWKDNQEITIKHTGKPLIQVLVNAPQISVSTKDNPFGLPDIAASEDKPALLE